MQAHSLLTIDRPDAGVQAWGGGGGGEIEREQKQNKKDKTKTEKGTERQERNKDYKIRRLGRGRGRGRGSTLEISHFRTHWASFWPKNKVACLEPHLSPRRRKQ